MDLLVKLGLFPPQASTMATRVDALFLFITAVCVFFGVLVAVLITTFAFKFRRRPDNLHGARIEGSLLLEGIWSFIPLVIAMTIFAWSASVYFAIARPPDDALEIFVVGKQWMWKLQHMEGRREINELHVPVGRPVKLTMTSEDVIHSFFVPAFRVKADVVPGRYTTVWFEPTKPGRYHLFCTEFCGTEHSRMIGSVFAMDPYEYQAWLTGDSGAAGTDLAPEEHGRRLFASTGCTSCHAVTAGLSAAIQPAQSAPPAMTGPSLAGLYGKRVRLRGGRSATADESYLRKSIIEPMADVVAGYDPVMPTYSARLSEEEVLALVAYIKSLGATPAGPAAGAGGDASAESGAAAPDSGDGAPAPTRPAARPAPWPFPPRASDAVPAAGVGATLDSTDGPAVDPAGKAGRATESQQ